MHEEPALRVARVESLATRQLTPCGSGSMVWRVWGDGRPVVLLHGASGSWTHWIRNVQPLAEHFRVLAPDMPGFGDSDMPAEPHTAESLADVVASGLDILVPAPTDLDMAGFSFGGIIAGLVAARLGRRIGTLALLGAGGLALPPMRPPALLQIEPDMTLADVERVHRANLMTLMIGDPRRVDDLAVFLQMKNLRETRFRSGRIPESDALRRALPAIQSRLTSILGGRDAFMASRLDAYRHMLESFQPDLDFRVIAGAGHWTPYEAPEEVNAALVEMCEVSQGRAEREES